MFQFFPIAIQVMKMGVGNAGHENGGGNVGGSGSGSARCGLPAYKKRNVAGGVQMTAGRVPACSSSSRGPNRALIFSCRSDTAPASPEWRREWPPIDQPGAVGQGVHHRMDGFYVPQAPARGANWFITSVPPHIPMAGRPPARGNITVFSIQACPTFVKMNLGIDCRYAFM